MRILPVNFIWTAVDVVDSGDGTVTRRHAMVPLLRYDNLAKRQFHDGEEYPLVPLEARSRASHNQFFAALNDGFNNLPEDLSLIQNRLNLPIPPGGWINSDHLRKWCLCQSPEWCDIDEFDFDRKADAMKLATLYRKRDVYAHITVRGTHVTIKTAKSQSAAAMSKEPFEQSKRDVLDLVETMIGVAKGTLNKEAKRANT